MNEVKEVKEVKETKEAKKEPSKKAQKAQKAAKAEVKAETKEEKKPANKEVKKKAATEKPEKTEKKTEKKAEERLYTFNLRDAYRKPRKRRAKTAVKILKELIARHAKTGEVRISNALNALIWKHSANKPPRKVKVKVSKADGTAKAEPA
ncbi:MAG: 50S ribosomal protein L31e [Methanobacteriota archaeon]|nr:MAG: 50S ribosomal protein L31e [Euryarchaeota archaeon]